MRILNWIKAAVVEWLETNKENNYRQEMHEGYSYAALEIMHYKVPPDQLVRELDSVHAVAYAEGIRLAILDIDTYPQYASVLLAATCSGEGDGEDCEGNALFVNSFLTPVAEDSEK